MLLANTFTDIISYPLLDNEVWRWAAVFGMVLSSLVLGKIICIILKGWADRLDQVKNRFIVTSMLFKYMTTPLQLFLLSLGLALCIEFNLLSVRNLELHGIVLDIAYTGVTLAVAWFLYRAVELFEKGLLKMAGRTRSALDDQLVPLVRKSLRIVLVLMTALFIAQNIFDWDVGAFVAGLGIGGLAFALAAKDMLANLLGSVTIFADRPFKIGDRVKISGQDGIINEVGFRTTRMVLLNGHNVSIPNGQVANSVIENVSSRPFLKQAFQVTLTYDTPPEKMRRAVDILNEMLEARKSNFPVGRPPRVHFTDFNADSLGINVNYWFSPAEWWDFYDFNHEFNMELLERFNAEGLEFAFPTQTLYLHDETERE